MAVARETKRFPFSFHVTSRELRSHKWKILWNYCLHNAILVMQPVFRSQHLRFARGSVMIAELRLRKLFHKKMHCRGKHFSKNRESYTKSYCKSVLHRAANKDARCWQKTFSLHERTWLSLANNSYIVFARQRGVPEPRRRCFAAVELEHVWILFPWDA